MNKDTDTWRSSKNTRCPFHNFNVSNESSPLVEIGTSDGHILPMKTTPKFSLVVEIGANNGHISDLGKSINCTHHLQPTKEDKASG